MSGGKLRTDAPLTLLWGEADVLKGRATRRLIEGWLAEDEREYGLVRVDGGEDGLDGIVSELSAGSLMAPRRMLVVREVTALTNAGQRRLAERLDPLQPGLAVVLVAARQPDRRGSRPPVAADLRRAVEAAGQVVELSPPPERALPGWVGQEMERLGRRITRDAAQALCDRVGADLDRLAMEVEKLATYVGEGREVSVEDVRAVSIRVSEEDIFQLMDAIGGKDAASALTMLDGVLPEGSDTGDAIGLVGMIARQMRLIWQARLMRQWGVPLGRLGDAPEKLRERLPEHHNFIDQVRGRDWLARTFTEQAARFSDGQLARGIDRVYQADLQLKGLPPGPKLGPRTIVELLIADLCG